MEVQLQLQKFSPRSKRSEPCIISQGLSPTHQWARTSTETPQQPQQVTSGPNATYQQVSTSPRTTRPCKPAPLGHPGPNPAVLGPGPHGSVGRNQLLDTQASSQIPVADSLCTRQGQESNQVRDQPYLTSHHSNWSSPNRRAHLAHIRDTPTAYISGEQRLCCWVPQNTSYIKLLLQGREM